MKTLLIAAAALLTLGALPALAQEGGRDPFLIQTPGVTTVIGYEAPDTGSAQFPDVAGRPGSALSVFTGTLAPDTDTEAPVQTANSLPGRAPAYVQPGTATVLTATSAQRPAPRG